MLASTISKQLGFAFLASLLVFLPVLPASARPCLATPAARCACETGQASGACCGCCTRPVPVQERSPLGDWLSDLGQRSLAPLATHAVFGDSPLPASDGSLARSPALCSFEGASLQMQHVRLQI